MAAATNWALLPPDLVRLVVGKLSSFSDYVCFLGVCQPWRHTAMEDTNDHDSNRNKFNILVTCHNKLPMLMLDPTTTTTLPNNNNVVTKNLFDLTHGNFYHVQLPFPRHKHMTHIVGSSLGWLFITENNPKTITLFNPITSKTFYLPPCVGYQRLTLSPVINNSRNFIIKGVLSADPYRNPLTYEVVVIFDGSKRLGRYRRPRDIYVQIWSFVDPPEEGFYDVIHVNSRVYAVNLWSELFEVDFDEGSCRNVTKRSSVRADVAYLVVSDQGEILMVQQFWGSKGKTRKFKVFVLLEDEMEWREINNLGDRVLFVGNNQSVCVSAYEFPACYPNCIYYTDYRHVSVLACEKIFYDDYGVFSLDLGKKVQFPCVPKPGIRFNHPPIWLVPNLKGF